MILVVDDDAESCRTLTQLLRRLGYDASSCADGYEALRYLEHDVPVLVILDFNMPGLNGHDVLRKMRVDPRWKDVPVLMYTAETSEETCVESLRIGAQAHVVKGPAAWEQLFVEIRRLAGAST